MTSCLHALTPTKNTSCFKPLLFFVLCHCNSLSLSLSQSAFFWNSMALPLRTFPDVTNFLYFCLLKLQPLSLMYLSRGASLPLETQAHSSHHCFSLSLYKSAVKCHLAGHLEFLRDQSVLDYQQPTWHIWLACFFFVNFAVLALVFLPISYSGRGVSPSSFSHAFCAWSDIGSLSPSC